jgi:hypothetical protein
VLRALFEAVERDREALGVAGIGVPELLAFLTAGGGAPARPDGVGRALDAYIEAQVHAAVRLASDAAALVIDPSFDGTPTGRTLLELAARDGFPLRRHPGFVLSPAEVPDDFRGPRMRPLAERLDRRFAAVPGRLDAAVIGRAAQSLERDPDSWSDWDTPDETLQHLKQLWHVLVRFGRQGLTSASRGSADLG